MTEEERMRLINFINQHNRLNFVKRIENPNKYPRYYNQDGSVSTHQMGYAQDGNKYYAFPNIVQKKDGSLQRFNEQSWDAYEYARKTGEYIPFNTEKEAQWFTGNYKKYPNFHDTFVAPSRAPRFYQQHFVEPTNAL